MNQTVEKYNSPNVDDKELDFVKSWGVILKYKWSVLLITFGYVRTKG